MCRDARLLLGDKTASWTLSYMLLASIPILSLTMANTVGRLWLNCDDFSHRAGAEYLLCSALGLDQHV